MTPRAVRTALPTWICAILEQRRQAGERLGDVALITALRAMLTAARDMPPVTEPQWSVLVRSCMARRGAQQLLDPAFCWPMLHDVEVSLVVDHVDVPAGVDGLAFLCCLRQMTESQRTSLRYAVQMAVALRCAADPPPPGDQMPPIWDFTGGLGIDELDYQVRLLENDLERGRLQAHSRSGAQRHP